MMADRFEVWWHYANTKNPLRDMHSFWIHSDAVEKADDAYLQWLYEVAVYRWARSPEPNREAVGANYKEFAEWARSVVASRQGNAE